MATKKGYNGYKNYNAWNVSLWINNDEGLYNMARRLCRHHTRDEAARLMLQDLNDCGITKTPDGAPYTITSIKGALVGI